MNRIRTKQVQIPEQRIKKLVRERKEKEYTSQISFDCNGTFLTHKWDGRVNVPVSEDLMSRVCIRCGKKYSDLYAERKQKILDRYRTSVGKSLNEKPV